jgi:ubiquinol-cytochrome c reductase iron-sulfur subunit
MADSYAEGVDGQEPTRRDFLYIATTAAAGVGAAISIWPFVDQMNTAANVAALSTTEVDLSPIEEGQTIKVVWQKKPVYIRHRTAQQISAAKAVDLSELPHPEADADRVQKDEWLVITGVCTHLGCIPLDDPENAEGGEFKGWFCPCHGSHYDGSGRIRKGPAPDNLAVPHYEFIEDTKIMIG